MPSQSHLLRFVFNFVVADDNPSDQRLTSGPFPGIVCVCVGGQPGDKTKGSVPDQGSPARTISVK